MRADFAEMGAAGGTVAAGFFAAALAAVLLATRAVAAVLADVDELPLEGAALRITLLAAGLVPAGVLTACKALTDRLEVIAADAGDLAACDWGAAGDFAVADGLELPGVRDGLTALVAAIPLSCLGAGDAFPLVDLAAVPAMGRDDDLPLGAALLGVLLPAFDERDLAAAALALADLAGKPAAVLVLPGVAGAGAAAFFADGWAAARLAGGADFAFKVALGGAAADFLSAGCFESDANGLAFADDFVF